MRSFISIYALIICLAISGILFHTFYSLDSKKDYILALYFQKQAHLYSITLKDIALKCIKDNLVTITSCRGDINFNPYFSGEYVAHKQEDILLDILIKSPNLLSTHPLQFVKRYIIEK